MRLAGEMEKFIYKCVIITSCVAILLFCFYPKYERFDDNHKINKITGKVIHMNDIYST